MRHQLATALVLLAAVTLLVPSVETTAREFEGYHYDWDPPWEVFTHPGENPGNRTPSPVDDRWRDPLNRLDPIAPFICDEERIPTWTEVTEYPSDVRKNESFTLGGYVRERGPDGAGVPNVPVAVYINETKTAPGSFLGEGVTDANGTWRIQANVPFPLTAQRYHIVNNAQETRDGCRVFLEAWSDPEVDVFSATRIEFSCPERHVALTNFTCTGQLVDEVGAGVPGREIVLALDGERLPRVNTSGDGSFVVPLRFERLGEHEIAAGFEGDKYNAESVARTTINSTLGIVQFDGDAHTNASRVVTLVRGESNVIEGRVLFGDVDLEGKNATLVADGVPRADCHPGCGVIEETVTLRADGAFEVPWDVPEGAPVGEGTVRLEAEFVEPDDGAAARVVKGAVASVHVDDPEALWTKVPVTARVVDDTGAPVADALVRVTLERSARDPLVQDGRTNADGEVELTFPHEPLGSYEAHAFFEGDAEHAAAHGQTDFNVVVPWAFWALAGVLLAGVVVVTGDGWRRLARYAAKHARAEPWALTITTPDDGARDRVGVGEAMHVVVPRVPGATHVRVHAPDAFDAPGDVPYPADADAPARFTLHAARRGEGALRVAAVDADGTLLARGGVRVASVRYGEDVEAAYRALVTSAVGADAAERVTPREFEAFLVANAPDLPAESLARLVSVFEVADYSHHAVTREDYVRFRVALKHVREHPERVRVARDAVKDTPASTRATRKGVDPSAS